MKELNFNSIFKKELIKPIKFSNPLTRKSIKEMGRKFELRVKKHLINKGHKGHKVYKLKSRHYD